MAARRIELRMAGIALASLCFATTTRAQVGYTGPTVGCFGVMCMPVVSLTAFTVPDYAVPWAFTGFPASSELATGGFGSSGFRSVGYGTIARNTEANDADDDRDEAGAQHFNKAAAVYTGVAFTVLVAVLESPIGNGPPSSVAAPQAFLSVASNPISPPVTAHLDFAQTSTLVATPEPITLTLTATGLLALGILAFPRRGRRTNA